MSSSEKSTRGAFFRKRWVRFILAGSLSVVVFFLLLPVGLKYYVSSWLVKNGAESATIQSLRFNPFVGRLSMEGMDVVVGGRPLLHNAKMIIDLGLGSLFNRDIHLQTAVYEDLAIDVEQYEDGSWRVGSYTMAAATPPVEGQELQSGDDVAKAWAFLADHVVLENCRVALKTPDLALMLAVQRAELTRFTTRQGAPAGSFRLDGTINENAVRLDLDTVQIAPALSLAGLAKVDGFQLEELSQLLADVLPQFAGKVGIDGIFRYRQQETGALDAVYDGILALDQAEIGNGDFLLSAGELNWHGNVSFSMAEQAPMRVETEGSLAARAFDLNLPGADFRTREERIELTGKTDVDISTSVQVEHDGEFLVESLQVIAASGSLEEKRLHWQGITTYDSDHNTGEGQYLQSTGELLLEGFRYTSQAVSAGGETATWDGLVRYRQNNNDTLPSHGLETEGILAARDFELNLPGADFSTSEAGIDLTGKTQVNISESIQVAHDGALLVEGLQLMTTAGNYAEERLNWQGKTVYDSDYNRGEGQYVQSSGALSLEDFQYNSPAASAGGEKVIWDGLVRYRQNGESVPSLAVGGTLDTTEIQTAIGQAELQVLLGQARLVADINAVLGEDPGLTGSSGLSAERLTVHSTSSGDPLFRVDTFNAGDIVAGGGRNLTVGKIDFTGIGAVVEGGMPLDVQVGEFHLGELSTSDWSNYNITSLVVNEPSVHAVQSGEDLVRLDRIELDGLAVGASGKIDLARLQLHDLSLLTGGAKDATGPLAAGSMLTVSALQWSTEEGLAADRLELTDLTAALVRDRDGILNVSQRLAAMKQAPEEAETPVAEVEGEAAGGIPFSLREIVISGDSSISFADKTMAVPYETLLSIQRLNVIGLDSRQPDQKTQVLLEGELEKRAPVKLTGYVLPFMDKPVVDMQLELKNYPLSSLSSYTVQSVGTALASGQLQLNMVLGLAGDSLDMKNNVVLKKLETKTISKELAAELNNKLPIPLDAALSILRDSDRNISLEIPLQGPLSSLNVGISDVIITALGKAIVPAASGYLMYTLGPYGALAYVGMKVGEKMLQVQLPPVIFTPGETALHEDHAKYLERIAKILKDRPETDIQLCPLVGAWELLAGEGLKVYNADTFVLDEATRVALLALGEARGNAVQEHLRSAYSIEQNRLLICDTVIEKDRALKPSVLLQM